MNNLFWLVGYLLGGVATSVLAHVLARKEGAVCRFGDFALTFALWPIFIFFECLTIIIHVYDSYTYGNTED